MGTDKGPQRQWLKEMGKTNEPWCVRWMDTTERSPGPIYDGVHGLETEWADRRRDERWCEQVFDCILYINVDNGEGRDWPVGST